LNKVVLLVVLLFIVVELRAQSSFQQLTFGSGGGAATTYAGTQLQKTTFAWFADAGYCPFSFLNIDFEMQTGSLAGASLNTGNPKSFNSRYRAVILNLELHAGAFLEDEQSGFLNAARHVYIGTGFGLLNNNITNVNIATLQAAGPIKNTLHVIPFKLGYELNLINNDDGPLLKADLTYTLNYTRGRGLDGYYDNNSSAFYFYNYYALGLKYAITLRDHSGRRHYKLD